MTLCKRVCLFFGETFFVRITHFVIQDYHIKRKGRKFNKVFPCLISATPKWAGFSLWMCGWETQGPLVPLGHFFFNLCKKTLCFTPRCFCTVSEDTFPDSEASQHFAFSTALARALMTHSLVLMPEEQAKLHVLPCLSLCKAEVQFHRWLVDSVFMFAASSWTQNRTVLSETGNAVFSSADLSPSRNSVMSVVEEDLVASKLYLCFPSMKYDNLSRAWMAFSFTVRRTVINTFLGC